MTAPSVGWLLLVCALLVVVAGMWRVALARLVGLCLPPLAILAWAFGDWPGLPALVAAALVWAHRVTDSATAWPIEVRTGALYALCVLDVGADPLSVWGALLAVCAATDWPDTDRAADAAGRAGRAAGLCLWLFGLASTPTDPELGAACQAIGLATLIATLPALSPVLFLLLARPGDPAWIDTLWLLGGGGLALTAVLAISRAGSPSRLARLGVTALVAVALGATGGASAAWVLVSGFAVSAIAERAIPRGHHAARLGALGLIGVPPFGIAAGLLMLLGALAAYETLAAVIAVAAWPLIAWPVIREAAAGTPRTHEPWPWAWLALTIALPASLAWLAP